jgi:hypothetical protein
LAREETDEGGKRQIGWKLKGKGRRTGLVWAAASEVNCNVI